MMLVVRWNSIYFSSNIAVVFFTLQMWLTGLLLLSQHSCWLDDSSLVSNLSTHITDREIDTHAPADTQSHTRTSGVYSLTQSHTGCHTLI